MPLLDPLISILEVEPGIAGWPGQLPPASTAPFTASNTYLQETFGGTAQRFADLGVAIIDFNPAPGGGPVMFSWNDADFPIGSLAKVAILYAAFQLRQDVRDCIREKPAIANAPELLAQLKAHWRAAANTWSRFIAAQAAPKLDKIFDLTKLGTSSAANIDFKGMKQIGSRVNPVLNIGIDRAENLDASNSNAFDSYAPNTDPALTENQQKAKNVEQLIPLVDLDNDLKADNKEALIAALELIENTPDGSPAKWDRLADMDFAQRLWLTTVWSDNCAATTCICDISLKYVQALMRASGLDLGDGGMTLRSIYQAPVGAKAQTRYCRDALQPATFEHQALFLVRDVPISVQSGRVSNVARFLIGLQQGSVTASNEMIRFLRGIPGGRFGFTSFLLGTLDPAGFLFDDVWSKIGIAGGNWFNDFLFVQRGPRGFGFVVLGERDEDRFAALASELSGLFR